jgi:hypothetical protein
MKKRFSAILLAACGLLLFTPFTQAEESLCASVEMQISQEMTMERQAFNAKLVIHNGLSGINLTDVSVTMKFTNGSGDPVTYSSDPNATTNLFFVAAPSLSHINALPGGTVSGGTSAEINWLIIPSAGAAATSNPDGTIYYVGATLTYTLNGEETVMEIAPDSIYVKPLPLLALDYFLPGNVYGDDAFTPDIVEPSIPFAFGLRVRNEGFGVVKDLKLISGQPKIVANTNGLVVGMKLLGSSMNGQTVTPSLALDFNNFDPLEIKMGYWIMESSLSGNFTNFTAEVSHADELGGQLTSLIPETNVNTHLFLKDVVVDLPGRDSVVDFLVDGDSTVYESDGTDSEAFKCVSAYLQEIEPNRYTFHFNSDLASTQQLLYASFQSPYPTGQVDRITLKSVVRSDGKRMLDSNVWLSKDRVGTAWTHYFNLFDVNGTNYTYTVLFEDTGEGNQTPVIYPIGSRTAYAGQAMAVIVSAYDPDGTIPQLSVSHSTAASFVLNTNVGDLAVGTLSWTPSAGDVSESPYDFVFTAHDGVAFNTAHCLIAVMNAPESTNYPAWWLNRGVINTNEPANDYAAVNIGQVKYLAAMAWEEFNQLPGGVGIQPFDFTNGVADYAAVNLGQLKALAAPFYDRMGMTNSYPWPGSTNPVQDFAMANIGQTKYLFGFDPLKDSDADGMPDWWEKLYSESATGFAPEADLDEDDRSNLKEYLQGTDPTVAD